MEYYVATCFNKFSFITEKIMQFWKMCQLFALSLFLPCFFLSSPSRTGFVGLLCFPPIPVCWAVPTASEDRSAQVQRTRRQKVWVGLGSWESHCFGVKLKGCPFFPCPWCMFRGEPVTVNSPVPGQCRVCGRSDWLSSWGLGSPALGCQVEFVQLSAAQFPKGCALTCFHSLVSYSLWILTPLLSCRGQWEGRRWTRVFSLPSLAQVLSRLTRAAVTEFRRLGDLTFTSPSSGGWEPQVKVQRAWFLLRLCPWLVYARLLPVSTHHLSSVPLPFPVRDTVPMGLAPTLMASYCHLSKRPSRNTSRCSGTGA